MYDAELLAPLDFGSATPATLAPPGRMPAPDAILNARLVTPLDSSHTLRGTPLEAIVTEPVFSADHQLVLPEGSKLIGEVTFATAARRFRRSGRLRFLVESVQPPQTGRISLRRSTRCRSRTPRRSTSARKAGRAPAVEKHFIAPALSVLALRAHRHTRSPADRPARTFDTASAGPGSRGVGGFFGWGLTGARRSRLAASRPRVGDDWRRTDRVSRRFAKGHEVTFPADTISGCSWRRATEPAMIARLATFLPPSPCSADDGAAHVETRLVVVAAVRNARGELVTGLTRDAFTVTRRQAPRSCCSGDDVPVSLGLLIGNGSACEYGVEAAPSIRPRIQLAGRDVRAQFCRQEPHRCAVHERRAYSNRHRASTQSAYRQRDAIAEARCISSSTHDRKVLVVITDGNARHDARPPGAIADQRHRRVPRG